MRSLTNVLSALAAARSVRGPHYRRSDEPRTTTAGRVQSIIRQCRIRDRRAAEWRAFFADDEPAEPSPAAVRAQMDDYRLYLRSTPNRERTRHP